MNNNEAYYKSSTTEELVERFKTNDGEALNEMGRRYEKNENNCSLATSYYYRAYEAGSLSGAYYYALLCYDGDGVAKNIEKAYSLMY